LIIFYYIFFFEIGSKNCMFRFHGGAESERER